VLLADQEIGRQESPAAGRSGAGRVLWCASSAVAELEQLALDPLVPQEWLSLASRSMRAATDSRKRTLPGPAAGRLRPQLTGIPASSSANSAARQPIIIAGALVFPETISGMIDASATRRLLRPRSFSL
jgi:hypothetical protein